MGMKATVGAVLSTLVLLAAPVAAAGARTPTHVACIGDSITVGDGPSSPSNYPSRLRQLFDAGTRVENFGHSGATMLTTGDLPYEQQPEYAAATAFVSGAGPGAVVDVVVMLGTNDSKPQNWMPHGVSSESQFVADYAAMIDHFTSLPTRPTVYLVLPPSAFANVYGISGSVIRDAIVPVIRYVAAKKGMPVIDLNAPTAALPGDFVDGVHPNDSGTRIMARQIEFALLAPEAPGASPADASVTPLPGGAALSPSPPPPVGSERGATPLEAPPLEAGGEGVAAPAGAGVSGDVPRVPPAPGGCGCVVGGAARPADAWWPSTATLSAMWVLCVLWTRRQARASRPCTRPSAR
jgi:acyl-CoA thioesterase-1